MIEAWLSASEMTASSFAQQRLEQAAVGVEAGGVEDRVLGAEEGGDLRFQLLVQVLGAADEAHRGHAEAVRVERLLGGGDHGRVVGQAEVVVGAEVQHLAAVARVISESCGLVMMRSALNRPSARICSSVSA
jgi:hypothetical protein